MALVKSQPPEAACLQEIRSQAAEAVCQGHQIALCFAQDNLGFKKVLATAKNPSKLPIMCFARIKKINLPHD
jgi:hypothetical protein